MDFVNNLRKHFILGRTEAWRLAYSSKLLHRRVLSNISRKDVRCQVDFRLEACQHVLKNLSCVVVMLDGQQLYTSDHRLVGLSKHIEVLANEVDIPV